MTTKTRIFGAVGAAVVGSVLFAGCFPFAQPTQPAVTVTVTPTPAPEVRETPTAVPSPTTSTAEQDGVFNSTYQYYFGEYPSDEVVAAARSYAQSANEAYASGVPVETIFNMFMNTWGGEYEDGVTLWAVAIASYGSDDLWNAAQAWAKDNANA